METLQERSARTIRDLSEFAFFQTFMLSQNKLSSYNYQSKRYSATSKAPIMARVDELLLSFYNNYTLAKLSYTDMYFRYMFGVQRDPRDRRSKKYSIRNKLRTLKEKSIDDIPDQMCQYKSRYETIQEML